MNFQKNKIKKIIKEMMNAGIIRSSTNPYSSLIILMKKKDRKWRFCVDYRALNKITILDKFSILMIDVERIG